MAVPTIVEYLGVPEHVEQLAKLLVSNWELLHSLGLTTDRPAFLMQHSTNPALFIEVFEWKDESGPTRAWDYPEITELWNDIQSLCQNEVQPEYYQTVSATYHGGG